MYNRAVLIGRLTADPELKTTQSGVSVCSFRIAVDRAYKKDGERGADFITIVAWRQQADFICRYFAKGRAIGIEGSIQTREYTDKDGNKRNAFEVVADRVFFVESKGQGNTGTQPSNINTPPSGQAIDFFEPVDSDDDLPF